MHLLLDLDFGEAADRPLTLTPDHEAWRVLDVDGRSVGVGYLAKLGVSSASHPMASATSIEVVHTDDLDTELEDLDDIGEVER